MRAMADSKTPQEKRRFLLALGDFRQPALIERTLALSLTDTVATQDVIFLLTRLLANSAARETTWSFIKKRWPKLSRRVPSLLASRLIDATPSLLTPAYRRDVAAFFRAHPVASGERALRQALERFDWYKTFRRTAGPALRKRLAPFRQ
jgi:aminopeptidase N